MPFFPCLCSTLRSQMTPNYASGEGKVCVTLGSVAWRKAKFLKRADRYTSTNVRCLSRAFFLVLLSCECAMSTRRKMLNYCCCGYFSTSKCLLVCSIFLQYREMKSTLQYLLPYVSIGSEETRSIPLKALEIRCSGGLYTCNTCSIKSLCMR